MRVFDEDSGSKPWFKRSLLKTQAEGQVNVVKIF
jgi:hypothetical protein